MQKKYAFAKGYLHALKKANIDSKLRFIMRVSISCFVCLLITLQLFAAGVIHAQNVNESTVRFGVQHETLKHALEKLEGASGFAFFYPSDKIAPFQNISINEENRTVAATLDLLLKQTGLDFKQQTERNIVIFEASPKEIAGNRLPPGSRVFLGRVTDSKGNALPGVAIRIRGSQLSTQSSSEGQFTILVENFEKESLIFSYVGYKTQEVFLKGVSVSLDIVMKEDLTHLDEVQVIAYGQTTKRLNIGNQTTISGKEISQYATNNVLDVLQGSVPGLVIQKTNGMPGSAYNLKLGGNNGLVGFSNGTGSDPLYIIDGIPYQGGGIIMQNNTLGIISGKSGYTGNALNFINPQDIESINVLKDAEATSIYGSRAANGVILITTKKGKAGAIKVDVNTYTGIAMATRLPTYLNTQQYLEMRHEAIKNDGKPAFGTFYDIDGTYDTTRNFNWVKQLIGGHQHTNNNQVTLSGGNESTQFLVGANYNRQDNLEQLGGSNRTASLHFSINSASASKKLTLNLTGSYLYNINTIPNTDIIGSITLPPDSPPVYNPDGSLNFANNTFSNPYIARNQINNTSAYNLTSSAIVGYKILTNLDFKVTLGYNRQEVNELLGSPTSSYLPSQNVTVGSSRFTTTISSAWNVEPQINYRQTFGKSRFTETIGATLLQQLRTSTRLQAAGYTSDALITSISGGTTLVNAAPYYYEKNAFSASFGRFTYNYDNKYLLNVSGRYDGSSKFGNDRQFHLFGAVGAGWIFTEEKVFKKNESILSFGKLRASYGVTGNDQIPAYGYLQTYGTFSAAVPYQAVPGVTANGLSNPLLSWETTKKAEIGLELQFFKGRIGLEGSYYDNHTTNVLFSYPLSYVTGFGGISQNIPATIENKGWEFTLNTVNINAGNFSWKSRFIFTLPHTALTNYPNLLASSFSQLFVLGMPTTIQKVYRFAGVNPQTGLYQFYDHNGNITASPVSGTDNTAIVNLEPKFYGSLTNSFSYKGFDLDFNFRFIRQMGRSPFGLQQTLPAGLSAVNVTTYMLARWQKPGDITNIQRYGTSFNLLTPISNALSSDAAYGDASYIRLQNLALGYRLSPKVLNKLHISNLRIYIQGDNLLTISRYAQFDPESQSATSLPPLKDITVGLQASF